MGTGEKHYAVCSPDQCGISRVPEVWRVNRLNDREHEEQEDENVGRSSDNDELPAEERCSEKESDEDRGAAHQERLFDQIRFIGVGEERQCHKAR